MKTFLTCLSLALVAAIAASPLFAQSSYSIFNLAGSAGTFGAYDATGKDAQFNTPENVAVDGSGNVYVADRQNDAIRKITPDGVVTTFAGTLGSAGSTDGTGGSARFNGPYGVGIDASNNLYVADTGNNLIRKITPDGGVTTLAGVTGTRGSTDGTAGTATFSTPRAVAVDGSGNVYVADSNNETIRKIAAGSVSTLAGKAGFIGSTDGSGDTARFDDPTGVAVDGTGNIYVADSVNSTIRKVDSIGNVTTLAGTAGATGSTDGTSTSALFNNPQGLAADTAGNIYVADSANGTIRLVTPDGTVSTLAGFAGTTGSANGTGDAASFSSPQGIAVGSESTIYVADTNNSTIREGIPYVADLFQGVATSDRLKKSSWFRFYDYTQYPLVYQFDLGYLYAYDAGNGGVYLYDYTSGHFWYTQASYFPYIYDFSLNTFLYYYEGTSNPRYFYDTNSGQTISE